MPHLLVVGAGPGIAAATARRLGRDGYAVSLVSRGGPRLDALAEELAGEGIDVHRAAADAGDPAALAAAVDGLVAARGPVDVLLFNVSVGRTASAADLSAEQLLDDVAAGVVGLQAAVRAVLPGMRAAGGGTVLATGGGAADRPIASMASLGVQKAALRALVESQAAVLAEDGVHVATVTVRGLVGDGDRQISPDRVAAVYAELVAETAGPREAWRTVVDLR